MKTFSLKQSSRFLLAIVLMAFFAIGAVSFVLFKKIQRLNHLSDNIELLRSGMLEARKNEKDFLAREVISADFFTSGKSKYIEAHNKDVDTVTYLLSQLRSDDFIAQSAIDTTLKFCENPLKEYKTAFGKIVAKVIERGFKDYGTEGVMRKAIHTVEAEVEKRHNDKQLIHTLLLRRHEKDFLLRKDTAYIRKFNSEWKTFSSEVKADKVLTDCLLTYKNAFDSLVQLNMEIGLHEKDGLLGEMRTAIHKTEPRINAAHATLLSEIAIKIENTMLLLIVMIVICSVITIIIMQYIINQVFKQVGGEPAYVASIAKEIAIGNLAVQLKQPSEYSGIMHAIALMVGRLESVLKTIVENSEVIQESSQQLSQAAIAISSGASEQASSVEELSATMEEISSNIEHTAANAQQTSTTTAITKESIVNASQKAQQSISASRDIAEKTELINYIAQKTSILAINASIEAARAGISGNGFAVVAQEVQKLADNSVEAAKGITDLAKKSSIYSHDTGTLMEKSILDINTALTMVNEISISSAEQNIGVGQINTAIQQFNSVIQQNAASSEELASSAELLATQAQRLHEATQYFRIKGNIHAE